MASSKAETVVAGCCAIILLALLVDSLFALLLMAILGYFGLHVPYLVCFGILILGSAIFGGSRGGSSN